MKQKDVDNLLLDYMSKGMLQHPDLLKQVQRSLKRLPSELPLHKLGEGFTYFRVLPLLGQLEILLHKIEHGTISKEQEKRAIKLERLYQDLFSKKPNQQIMATDLENPERRVFLFNPRKEPIQDLEFTLIQNGACYLDKRKLPELVRTFYDDSLFGGSFIVTVEKRNRENLRRKLGRIDWKSDKKSNPVLTVAKYFLCVDKNGEPTLAVDMYSHGDYVSRGLSDWQSSGKIDLFAYGPASLLYLAKSLGIKRIAFCDLEMEEFGKLCGIQTKSVFKIRSESKNSAKYDERKAGIITVPNNSKGVWNHIHSVYNHSNGRYVCLDYEELSLNRLSDIYSSIIDPLLEDLQTLRIGGLNAKKFRKLQVEDRFNAAYLTLRIIEKIFLKSRKFGQLKQHYNATIDKVKTINPLFARTYVK